MAKENKVELKNHVATCISTAVGEVAGVVISEVVSSNKAEAKVVNVTESQISETSPEAAMQAPELSRSIEEVTNLSEESYKDSVSTTAGDDVEVVECESPINVDSNVEVPVVAVALPHATVETASNAETAVVEEPEVVVETVEAAVVAVDEEVPVVTGEDISTAEVETNDGAVAHYDMSDSSSFNFSSYDMPDYVNDADVDAFISGDQG